MVPTTGASLPACWRARQKPEAIVTEAPMLSTVSTEPREMPSV